ncbi:hypothetical protein [Piscinibacter terrae]|uniref:hypothetical protein n=1 Tax=Piscinibacter terrae TaxID=2496871 RepID=UPI0018E0AA4F|nr:hypothetical protein [Albitalea terrae]
MRSALIPLVMAGTLLTGCATTSANEPGSPPTALKPFTTDGCSMFPDRSAAMKADWCHCCVVHDLAYWRGGTADARLSADRTLQACVLQATNDQAFADLMFNGVRVGGGPGLPTPYRWGYGWPYGRGYKPLTPDEEAQAQELEADYRSKHPTLPCPSAPASSASAGAKTCTQ